MRMSSTNLLDLSPAEMEELAQTLGAPRYRGRQLAQWIFVKGVADLESMTDLPKDFRTALAGQASVELPEV
ncbi:MAG: 23S rRNA (adenine(2503)-C(2))-methyltransferase RlmN, partial [Acidobacteria bacterium]